METDETLLTDDERYDTTQLAIFLNTELGLFWSWLEDYTQEADLYRFRSEDGWLSLDLPAIHGGGPIVLEMVGKIHEPARTHEVGVLIDFKLQPLATARTEVLARCYRSEVRSYFFGLLGDIGQRWPETAPAIAAFLQKWQAPQAESQAKRGPKAGTLDRVKEAHRLITQQHLTRNKAFKRARTDSRTYDRQCKEATGEDPILSYSE